MIKTYVIIAMMGFNFGAGVVNGFYWSSGHAETVTCRGVYDND
jgi:hypothetical protein